MTHAPLVLDLVVLLVLAIPAALVFRQLKLPSVAGFLAVGALVGPHALGWVTQVDDVEVLAEIGVVLLLFTIGLEFSLPKLLLNRRRLLLSGAGQVCVTVLLVALIARVVGLGWPAAILAGFVTSLSSTAFVLKIFHDGRRIEAPEGQFSIGILLFQDLVVVLMLLAIPWLGGERTGSIVTILGQAAIGVVLVVLFARYGFPRLASVIVRLGGRELFVLFVALITLGAAWVTESLGLSVALGAFMAGLFISESQYSHQVVSEVLPFRDVFNALFFVSVGMLLDVSALMTNGTVVAGLVLVVLVVKGAIVTGLGLWLMRSARVAVQSGLALAQIGEFSFIVAQEGRAVELLDAAQYQLFLAVAVITMFLTPFVIAAGDLFFRRTSRETAAGSRTDEGHGPDVVIVGYGLTGRNLARVLHASRVGYRILELNPVTVRWARTQAIPMVFGDAGSAETLKAVGVPSARVVVFAISDPASTRRAVRLTRDLAPNVHIIVRTQYMTEQAEFLELGADDVVPSEFETSIEIFRRTLRHLHVPPGNIAVQAALIRREAADLFRDGSRTVGPSLEAVQAVLRESEVDTMAVAPDSPTAGRSLSELELRARTGVLVVAIIKRDNVLHAPGPDAVLEPGDFVTVVGDHAGIEGFRDILSGVSSRNPAADRRMGAGGARDTD